MLNQLKKEHNTLFENKEGDREIRGYYVLIAGKDPKMDDGRAELVVLTFNHQGGIKQNKKMFKEFVVNARENKASMFAVVFESVQMLMKKLKGK